MLPWPVDSLGFLEQVCAYMFNFYTYMVINAIFAQINIGCLHVLMSQAYTGSQSHVVH